MTRTSVLQRGIVLAAIAGLVTAAVVVLQPAVSSVLSASLPPAIACDTDDAVFGSAVTCTASGDGVVGVRWPDGLLHETVQAIHAPQAIGAVQIEAVDAHGAAVATTSLVLTPDVTLECGASDTEKIVYELAATDLRPEGWDYVYTDPATGNRVAPGDANHPGQAPTDSLERIEMGTARSTTICRLTSEAVEALDGTYSLQLDSEFEPTMTTEQRIMGPASKTKWAGAQPGELTGTVTVGAVTASERVGVYLAGCA